MYSNILTPNTANKTNFDISKDEVLQFIKPFVKNKSVLDLGCIEHDLSAIHKNRIWVHDFLHSVAREVIGVDYLQEAVKELNNIGYDIVCQNVEKLNINKKFDVVFAGELIEHLGNVGQFLENVKKHMKNKGLFILTTPNAFSLQRFMSIIWHKTNIPNNNPEHVSYYSPDTIENLLERYDFKIKKIVYANYPVKKMTLKQRLIRIFCPIIGNHFEETMIVVATLN